MRMRSSTIDAGKILNHRGGNFHALSETGRRRGWSLIDVSLTVLILGVMSSIAVPRYLSTLHVHRAEAAARRIQQDLAWARQQALSRSTPVTVEFNVPHSSYVIPQLSLTTQGAGPYEVVLSRSPYMSVLQSANFGTAAEITFNRFGVPQSEGNVVVASGASQRTIFLSSDGRLTTIE